MKLKCSWTIEMIQDLKNMHNIDAEAELMAVLTQQSKAENHKNKLGENKIDLTDEPYNSVRGRYLSVPLIRKIYPRL